MKTICGWSTANVYQLPGQCMTMGFNYEVDDLKIYFFLPIYFNINEQRQKAMAA
jgi:hypothetical protein